MYRKNKVIETSIERNETVEGEMLEEKIERMMNNKEPIEEEAPLAFTERKEGVKPEYDIRTDRFEIAVEAMDQVQKAKQETRRERREALLKEVKQEKVDGKPESTDGMIDNPTT